MCFLDFLLQFNIARGRDQNRTDIFHSYAWKGHALVDVVSCIPLDKIFQNSVWAKAFKLLKFQRFWRLASTLNFSKHLGHWITYSKYR